MSKEMRKYIDTFNERMLNEIYSDKDMRRGDEIGKSSFGVDFKIQRRF